MGFHDLTQSDSNFDLLRALHAIESLDTPSPLKGDGVLDGDDDEDKDDGSIGTDEDEDDQPEPEDDQLLMGVDPPASSVPSSYPPEIPKNIKAEPQSPRLLSTTSQRNSRPSNLPIKVSLLFVSCDSQP